MQTQHGKGAGGRRSWEDTSPGGYTRTYRMAFPTAGVPWNCPIEGCPGRAATRTVMQVHFFHRHVRDTVIILDEGNQPPPTVPPMRNSGSLTCTEQEAPCHRTVSQGGGEEV